MEIKFLKKEHVEDYKKLLKSYGFSENAVIHNFYRDCFQNPSLIENIPDEWWEPLWQGGEEYDAF